MNFPNIANRATIAVVDNDSAARDSFDALLSSAGYIVETYASGSQFLSSVSCAKAQCVLLNMQLPDLDGRAVLEQLGELGANVPAILMTVKPKSISHAHARAFGAFLVLEKPIKEACLFTAIGLAIDGNVDF